MTLEADLFEEPKVSMAVAPSSSYNKLSSGILPEQGMDLKEHLNDLEYSLIQQALDDSEGVVAHAAKKLNMRRTTLVEKMRKHGLQRVD